MKKILVLFASLIAPLEIQADVTISGQVTVGNLNSSSSQNLNPTGGLSTGGFGQITLPTPPKYNANSIPDNIENLTFKNLASLLINQVLNDVDDPSKSKSDPLAASFEQQTISQAFGKKDSSVNHTIESYTLNLPVTFTTTVSANYKRDLIEDHVANRYTLELSHFIDNQIGFGINHFKHDSNYNEPSVSGWANLSMDSHYSGNQVWGQIQKSSLGKLRVGYSQYKGTRAVADLMLETNSDEPFWFLPLGFLNELPYEEKRVSINGELILTDDLNLFGRHFTADATTDLTQYSLSSTPQLYDFTYKVSELGIIKKFTDITIQASHLNSYDTPSNHYKAAYKSPKNGHTYSLSYDSRSEYLGAELKLNFGSQP